MRDLLTSWADNQYSSGMLQEALTSGCLGPTGKLGKNLDFQPRTIVYIVEESCKKINIAVMYGEIGYKAANQGIGGLLRILRVRGEFTMY